MPRQARKVCSVARCPTLTEPGHSRCTEHEREAEAKRGTAAQRGYDHVHRARFRKAVLAKHPICQICGRDWSVHADHHPLDRRELVLRGLDPNDPAHGRGLCASCHSSHTASAQPGGWNAR